MSRQPVVLLLKSHVKGHWRTLENGRIVPVRAHTDKRRKRDDKTMDLFDTPHPARMEAEPHKAPPSPPPDKTIVADPADLPQIQDLVKRGALFVVNHSGGKDSQAMFHYVRKYVPDSQIVVIHAHLPGVEWDGTWDQVQKTTLGLPTYMVQSNRNLLQMVEERGMFPSPKYRQCTSDLKRGPIEKKIRALSKERDNPLIVNTMGMRAEESSSRSKLETLKLNAGNSKAGREWYDWLPIHHLKKPEVFGIIKDAGQEPHWAYAAGMSRLSCVFCIMGSEKDLKTAAKLSPETYKKYVDLEKKTGQTMMMPKKGGEKRTLEQITGISAEPMAKAIIIFGAPK